MSDSLWGSIVSARLVGFMAVIGSLGVGCSHVEEQGKVEGGADSGISGAPSSITREFDASTERERENTVGASGEPTNPEAPTGALSPMSAPGVSGDAGVAAPANSAPAVHFVGRMDTRDPAGPRFAWSGTGMVANFSGTTVTLRLDDTGNNQFTVLLDGELEPKLAAAAGPNDYVLASGLEPGLHRVEVYRRTEASFGPTQFLGFDFGADGMLLPPPSNSRQIEIIGDSISAGYGNEGISPCDFSADTENHYLTYGAIAARLLGAELSTVAWSGKGVVYNYGTDVSEPMPVLYGRTLPQDPTSSYEFETQPDVVLINLGTNDFSTDDDPTVELFAAEYSGLLTSVRAAYPEASILCTVGPLLFGEDVPAARAGIAAGLAAFAAAGGGNARAWELNVPNGDPPGCNSHPNLDTHRAMADAVAAEIEYELSFD